MSPRFRGLPRDRAVRLLAWGAILAGTTLVAQAAMTRLQAGAWQARYKIGPSGIALGALEEPRSGRAPGGALRPVPSPSAGRAVARLQIARLGIDAVVTEGTDAQSLRLGPGHLPGSALPGESDNCIIAGHRDGAFGRLSRARQGDLVEVHGPSGTSRYRVSEVRVVPKDDVRPLEPSTRAELTLITCFPIHYVGPAPRRLVVRGELVAIGRS
jgi:sortase A